ncbi:hypothetical protein VTJ04DRAFT_8387 [Mycothermus thermophilus]|uniref:uncharacterized protein n=1 Tax=Humicola insolens TaxID=85995 RepID=UPI0037439CE0
MPIILSSSSKPNSSDDTGRRSDDRGPSLKAYFQSRPASRRSSEKILDNDCIVLFIQQLRALHSSVCLWTDISRRLSQITLKLCSRGPHQPHRSNTRSTPKGINIPQRQELILAWSHRNADRSKYLIRQPQQSTSTIGSLSALAILLS